MILNHKTLDANEKDTKLTNTNSYPFPQLINLWDLHDLYRHGGAIKIKGPLSAVCEDVD